MNIQGWFPLGLTCLIYLLFKGPSRVHNFKASFLWCSVFFYGPTLASYSTTGKIIALYSPLCAKWCLCFFIYCVGLSWLSFQEARVLISWLQSPLRLILEAKKIKCITASILSHSICHEVMGPDSMIIVLWILSFKPLFTLHFCPHQETL